MKSIESSFASQGLRCAGTLLMPAQGERPPVIVMAHGFAGVRAMLLPHAERFVEAGYAVFLFDYRNFGDSEGQPRHWVDPARHLADWEAAIRHVRNLDGLDTGRMVLWGTSLSGGHVVCMAAGGQPVAAVIAGHPLMSGWAAIAAMRPLAILRLTLTGLRDVIGSLVGKPHYLPVVGRPGEHAALSGAEAWAGMERLKAIANVQWENKVLGRVLLKIPHYNPIRVAHKVRVPTLVIAGSNDTIVSAVVARKASRRMRHGEFTLHASDHFQPYYGDYLDENVKVQLAFLHKHVPL
ncbi:alpha/beta hydrolase [Variovorax saccharolyticus]|uniref:alpha/beta hydrolase n=1 Tax=Variovorax saccharolyticus TaxID=3053516 RepID=UPI0025788CC5|nr:MULTISPECIES: alpha/beta fold hydrolase [unclassified Variovorax]MDM0019033.1 alpha/beta fold hydrolase [Variovorax sp. J22R187]MDM0026500.1 alpha/beta fold hydrolase [Variovorax sp. J31P216]